jgi:hypothetical protein
MVKLTEIQKKSLEVKVKKTRKASERNRLCVIKLHDKNL